ncbi:MAG TPA: hypothetical protein VI912_05605 [Candidatus Bilamarchaeaceae archaeon]|nr:hypothetical protein [Candidatus Bilamarchaeaceae archaeon]
MKKILALFLVFVLIFGCVNPKGEQNETKDQESNKSDNDSMEDKSDTNDSPEEDLSGVTVGTEGQEVTADDVPEVEDDEELDEMLNGFQ